MSTVWVMVSVGDLVACPRWRRPGTRRHAVDDDLEVQLAHAGDDGLAGVLVGADLEGGVLLGQALEGLAHLLLVDLGLGLDRHVDDRLGELELLQRDLGAGDVEGVAGARVLEADAGGDVAGHDRADVLTVVGVHLQDAADPLLDPQVLTTCEPFSSVPE